MCSPDRNSISPKGAARHVPPLVAAAAVAAVAGGAIAASTPQASLSLSEGSVPSLESNRTTEFGVDKTGGSGLTQETLYLLSTPGMRESIREGMATPPGEMSEEPGC